MLLREKLTETFYTKVINLQVKYMDHPFSLLSVLTEDENPAGLHLITSRSPAVDSDLSGPDLSCRPSPDCCLFSASIFSRKHLVCVVSTCFYFCTQLQIVC